MLIEVRIKKDHFIMGEKYGRVLFLKEHASYIKDSMINELTTLNRTMMLVVLDSVFNRVAAIPLKNSPHLFPKMLKTPGF